jgi:hypothetical protein
MNAVRTGERERSTLGRPSGNRRSRAKTASVLNEDSPFLLLAAAVVQQTRVDRAHRCSSYCKKGGECVQCERAAIRHLSGRARN